MNDRRLEDFAWMGESLVNNSLRNGFEFDKAKASVEESDGEDGTGASNKSVSASIAVRASAPRLLNRCRGLE
jgi:hypothetical protein